LNKYINCNVWRLVVRYDIYIYVIRRLKVNDLYSSTSIVRVIKWRRMRWAGHVARVEERRGVYRVFMGKPEGKRPLGRPRQMGG
jgi:hypothetical protein